jgi:hypothetical protein
VRGEIAESAASGLTVSSATALSTETTSRTSAGPRARAAGILGMLAALTFGAAIIGVWRGNELAATWFYDAAWWSYIFLVDAWVYRRRSSSLLWTHPRAFALLALWSAVFWLFFEVVNFRLQNWYYVGVPREEPTRTIGIFVSFATVLPGIFETSDLLATWPVFARMSCRPLRFPERARAGMFALGLAFLVLPLCFPRHAFPLIWGATLLMSEAWLLGRGSGGLLHEFASGRAGTLWRWLAAGLVSGLLWETWNSLARAHWIYTVPFFEDSKLFEMPITGFLGFPPFALECYSFARVLVAVRFVPDWEASHDDAPRARSSARAGFGALLAIAFAIPAVAGVNALTVRGTRPMVVEIPGVSSAFTEACARAGIHTTEELLGATGREFTGLSAGVDAADLPRILESARLMQVRGLGARGLRLLTAAGIETVGELARADPQSLHGRLLVSGIAVSPPPTPAEVRVWVRGARLEH